MPSNTIPERPDWYRDPVSFGESTYYEQSKVDAYMDYCAARIAELEELVQQSLGCITQGRVAFDDEQDMTDWYVASAELQARLNHALTTEPECNQ